MKFNIITLGCKVNSYESEVMKELLLKDNFIYTDDQNNADIIIINTCSVTNMADNKSKKMVRSSKRLNKIIVVCGCSSENNESVYKEMGIDILIGNNEKSKIVTLIRNYLSDKKIYEKFYHTRNLEFEDMTVSKFNSHTRAFVKIEDGCDNFCTYCIIPYVRGSIRHKEFNNSVEEVNTLVNNGHKEIVLTGIHTGSYNDNGKDLADLIHEISKNDNLKRIRISSIEVTELNDKLLNEIKNNDRIVNHFHIPLQAGSDYILKKMNRKYDLKYFEEKITKLRSIKEDVSITTDVIVGFPGETEEMFLETISNCKKFNFAKIHVFPYSKREGTPASVMPNQIDDAEKKRRSRVLNEVSKELEIDYLDKHIGKVVDVLIETNDNNISRGCTPNYLKVQINEYLEHNQIYKVKLIERKDNYLIGIVEGG